MDIDVDTLLELDPVKIVLDMKNGGYDSIMSVFRTTGEHSSCYDHMTLDKLLLKLIDKRKSNRSPKQVLQAIYNYYARKLSVPFLRVTYAPKNEEDYAAFMYGIDSVSKNATRIVISKNSVFNANPRYVFHALAHESKHEKQQYICYNYFRYNILPSTQLDMFHILAKMFLKLPYFKSFELTYELNPEELDAYLYDLEVSQNLIQSFEEFRQPEYIIYHYLKIQSLLCKFAYDKKGINNIEIKKVYKSFKQDIYFAMQGKYGTKYQATVKELIKNGFDLDKTFTYFTKRLDCLYDEFVCLSLKMKELGFFVPWEKNGNLLYKKSSTKSGNKYNLIKRGLLSRENKAKNLDKFIRLMVSHDELLLQK